MNWYVYTANNPLKYVDPLGLRLAVTGSMNEEEQDPDGQHAWTGDLKYDYQHAVAKQVHELEGGRGVRETNDILVAAVAVAVGGELAVGAATKAGPVLTSLASAVGAKVSSAVSWFRSKLFPSASAAEQQIAANSRTQIARTLGNAGESASGLAKNTTRIPSLTGTANYRIPDGLTNTTLSEVKNVSNLSYTSQLHDFTAYSQQKGLNFELYIRSTTQLTGPLMEAADMGDILLRYLP